MSRRTRYQQGSVQREKRQSGPDVWIFRWREAGSDGSGKQRKAIVGTVESFANEAAALQSSPIGPTISLMRHIRPVAKANGIRIRDLPN